MVENQREIGMRRILYGLIGLWLGSMPWWVQAAALRQPLDVAHASGQGDWIDTDHQHGVARDTHPDGLGQSWFPDEEWQRGRLGFFSLGVDRQPKWIKATLVNSGVMRKEVWVQVARPFVDVVDCSTHRGQEVLSTYQMGDMRPFSSRLVDAQDFLVPVQVLAGDRIDLVCKLQNNGSLTANLRSWEPAAYQQNERARRDLRYAAYGAILLATLVAAVVAGIGRNMLVMLMVVNFMPTMLGVATVDADLFRYLWPDRPAFNLPAYYWIVLGCITESLMLLQAARWSRRERWLVMAPAMLAAALGVVCWFTSPDGGGAWPLLSVLMMPMLMAALYPWMCIRHWHEGAVPRVLAVGVGLEGVAVTINTLGVLGVPWVYGLTPHFHLLVVATCVIKVVMMAVALALKIMTDRQARRLFHLNCTEELRDQLHSQMQTTAMLLQDARFGRPNQRALEEGIKGQSQEGHASVCVWLVRLNRLSYLQSAVPFETMTEVVGRFLDQLEVWLSERDGLKLIRPNPQQSIAVVGADLLAFCTAGKPDNAFVHDLESRLLKRFAWQQMYFAWDPHVGIACLTRSEAETDLLAKALQALARCTPQHRVQHFDSSVAHREQVLHGLTMDIGGAIERGELELHYQPKVDLETRATRSFEALVRWRHPERGLIAPGVFIAEAEATGAIHKLTLWAIREALGFVKSLGSDQVRVAVNITAFDIATPGFVHAVADILARERVSPERLTLEVTESVALEDAGDGARVLYQLQSMGIQVALDDFGSGQSSLGMLSTLPIDELKIDRSLVVGVETSHLKRSVLRSAIELGCRLGKTVTVEGVESAELVDWLASAGGHVVQGYYFSRPLSCADALAWFDQAKSHVLGEAMGVKQPVPVA